MGACDSAVKQVNSTTRAVNSTQKAINSVKKLINNKTQFNQMTSSSFDKYDKDKSGYIEESELKEVINEMAIQLNLNTDISQDDVKKVLDTIDINKDGKISKEEFENLSKEKLLEALR